ANVRHGGLVRGNAVATGIPLSRLDMLGGAGKMLDGSMSMVADVGGTLTEMEMTADVNLARVRIGASTLPPSRLRVTMEPVHEKKKQSQKTPICHDERGGVFDQNEYDKDLPAGVFRVGGSLFDGQVTFKD